MEALPGCKPSLRSLSAGPGPLVGLPTRVFETLGKLQTILVLRVSFWLDASMKEEIKKKCILK